MDIKSGIVRGVLQILGKLNITGKDANDISAEAAGKIKASAFVGPLEGTAASASALVDKNVGNATTPVYIDANGKPVKLNYTIQTSVPANAVFTDTNTWVANSVNAAGYVAAPTTSNKNKVWKTDANGVPAWRDDANTTYSAASQSANGLMSAADKEKLDGIAASANNYTLPVATSSALGGVKSGTDITVDVNGNVSINNDSHSHTIGNVTDLQTTLDSKVPTSSVGVASGVASLDSSGKVPASQLPGFVDDIVEIKAISADKKTATPVTNTDTGYSESTSISGEAGKLYANITDNKIYRWSGTQFSVVSETLALGETSTTAYRGDRGKTAYTHATAVQSELTAQSTQGLYKITYNAQGHITGGAAVTINDLTALGLPSANTDTQVKQNKTSATSGTNWYALLASPTANSDETSYHATQTGESAFFDGLGYQAATKTLRVGDAAKIGSATITYNSSTNSLDFSFT